MAKRFLLILLLVLAGCGGGSGVPGYTSQEVAQLPSWRKLITRIGEYRPHVCPDCGANDWKLGIFKTEKVNAYNAGDGVFYVTEGLTRLRFGLQDAALAHEVAHEVAGHVKARQAASLATTAAFVVLGAIIPGAGLLNHAVNPVITRAFSREQELEADSIAITLMRRVRGNDSGAEDLAALIRLFEASGSKGGELLDTHPHPQERLKMIATILSGAAQPLPIPADYTSPALDAEPEKEGGAVAQ